MDASRKRGMPSHFVRLAWCEGVGHLYSLQILEYELQKLIAFIRIGMWKFLVWRNLIDPIIAWTIAEFKI